MCLVAYWHGLRASEVVHIKRADVSDGYLTVRRLKGSLKTVQPLVHHKTKLLDERPSLERFVNSMAPNQIVFPVSRVWFWRLVQRYAKAASIPARKAHPHALKHSIAMHTIQIAGIENVRQWLGHKSMSSTGAYLRVTDDRAAQAVKAASRAI
jgi:site-specific recombinase XerD